MQPSQPLFTSHASGTFLTQLDARHLRPKVYASVMAPSPAPGDARSRQPRKTIGTRGPSEPASLEPRRSRTCFPSFVPLVRSRPMSSNKRESCSPPTSSDESSSFLEAPAAGRAPACRPVIRDPLWKLRRTNTAVGSLGGACLSVGCESCPRATLVRESLLEFDFFGHSITRDRALRDRTAEARRSRNERDRDLALYARDGLRRVSPLDVSLSLLLVFAASDPLRLSSFRASRGVASVILLGEKPSPDTFPPHARLLRALCLGSTVSVFSSTMLSTNLTNRVSVPLLQLVATLFAILALVLYVLLQERESFIDFW